MASYSLLSIEAIEEFKSFVGLCSGLEVSMNTSTKTIFENISRELENYELFSAICNHFSTEQMRVDNVISSCVEKRSLELTIQLK
jgi:hypothetical protein